MYACSLNSYIPPKDLDPINQLNPSFSNGNQLDHQEKTVVDQVDQKVQEETLEHLQLNQEKVNLENNYVTWNETFPYGQRAYFLEENSLLYKRNHALVKQQENLNNKNQTVTFNKCFKSNQLILNEISLASIKEPNWSLISDKKLNEPPFPMVQGKGISAGTIIQETDGRIWIYEPKNHFGGYEHTFPKGSQENGLTLQQTALKETFEECGLQVEIQGYLMDQERTTTVTRYYIAKRTGGDPNLAGWEADNVKLATIEDALSSLLNSKLDRLIIQHFLSINQLSSTLEDGQLFPGMLNQVKIINAYIGGVTGAKLVKDQQNRKFVQKEGFTPDHIRAEYHTNKAYKALGVKVPEVALYDKITSKLVKEKVEEVSEPVMLSTFVAGKILREYLEYPVRESPHLKEVQVLIQKDFVADCLLANWDVIGLSYDNVIIDTNTKEVWRIDNGSGLDHRALGAKKDPRFFDPNGVIIEFETFRQKNINPQASLFFRTIADQEIIEQIDHTLPKKDAFLATIPDHLKEIMKKRFDYLKIYQKMLKQKDSSNLE